MDMIKHVAKIANTDQRCVVAFLQIPNREDHALVVPTDNLPPRMEQAVMDVLKSPEAQNEENLGVVLARHLMPDTGQNILEALHQQNRLLPVAVEQVLMMPMPNYPVKLNALLESMGRLPSSVENAMLNKFGVEKFNPHLENQKADSIEQRRAIAQNLLSQAKILEGDARRKREEAYGYDPTLRPQEMKLTASPPSLESVAPQPIVASPPVVQPKATKRKKTA